MPAKNTVKTFVENSYYHVYNRGVEKRSILMDEQDCVVFLYYLKMYLRPIEELKKEIIIGAKLRFLKLNMSEEVDLLAFALMPNHIHLLLKQRTADGITKLMRRVITAYVMYFNKKHKRVGSLFQNIYKAHQVDNDPYLLHLSRYIHLNSRKTNSMINFVEFSSYPYYLGKRSATWIKPQEILSYFNKSNDKFSYKDFVEEYVKDFPIGFEDLTLEDVCVE